MSFLRLEFPRRPRNFYNNIHAQRGSIVMTGQTGYRITIKYRAVALFLTVLLKSGCVLP
jgi:hypothetical protein